MRYVVKNEEVQRVINCYGFGEKAVGRSYSYQTGDPWAYLDEEIICGTEIWSIRVSDRALKFPCKVREWVILHECGHIELGHPLHSGRANLEHELEADIWACRKQKTTQHCIQALKLMSNGNLDIVRMSIKRNTSMGWRYYVKFTYRYYIDEIKRRWELYL